MKTNCTNWLRRITIIVGTIWATTQAPARAETAPAAAPAIRSAGQIQAPAQAAPRIMLASASCVRVGNRMVC